MKKMLIVICGWPLSGKGTIAQAVADQFTIPHIDIDGNIREPIFGKPDPHPDKSRELMERDVAEMLASYKLLLLAAACFLEQDRSVILTATFSRTTYQDMLVATHEKHPSARLRIIWCLPRNDSPDEICRRIEKRIQVGTASAVNSMKRYLEVKNRFQPIRLTHLQLDSSPPHTEEQCIREAIAYVLSQDVL